MIVNKREREISNKKFIGSGSSKDDEFVTFAIRFQTVAHGLKKNCITIFYIIEKIIAVSNTTQLRLVYRY